MEAGAGGLGYGEAAPALASATIKALRQRQTIGPASTIEPGLELTRASEPLKQRDEGRLGEAGERVESRRELALLDARLPLVVQLRVPRISMYS